MSTSKNVSLRVHDWAFIPRVPFEIGRMAESVVFVHHTPEQPKVRVTMRAGQPPGIQLGPGTRDAEEVLSDFFDGEPDEGARWALVFEAGYRFEWPENTALWSTDDSVNWAVELTIAGGPLDQMLYVQGPFLASHAPSLEALIGPGMEAVGRMNLDGSAGVIQAIELAYQHEGQPWRQWRYLVPIGPEQVVLITAQTDAEGYAAMLALGQAVATQLHAA